MGVCRIAISTMNGNRCFPFDGDASFSEGVHASHQIPVRPAGRSPHSGHSMCSESTCRRSSGGIEHPLCEAEGAKSYLHSVRELNALLLRKQAQPTGCLAVITTAPPVRIFLPLRFGALGQILMLSMSIVFPLVVIDGFLRLATRHHHGRSYRHHEQKRSEVHKKRPHDNPLRYE